VPAEALEKLVHSDRINSLVLKELQETGRKAGLAHFEIIEGLVLTDAEWTPQNVGCLHRAMNQQCADKYCRAILHQRRN
jgi:long-subunit acyl-CoA synthetase (AMP-forming)